MAVLDLSSEYKVQGNAFRRYTCVPMLDLVLPDRVQLRAAADCLDCLWADLQKEPGRQILVACGLGRGRSAATLYFWLRHGVLALSPDDAFAMLQVARPEILLSDEHRLLLDAGGAPPMAPARRLLAAFLRMISGVRIEGLQQLEVTTSPCVFFANHSSHADAAMVWASLPAAIRAVTKPVAAADYWRQNRLRGYLSETVFDALLIERQDWHLGTDALAPLRKSLACGQNLLMFPEGTRNNGHAGLGRFKSGLYHLARSTPSLRLIPVYLEGVQHVLPKGARLPVPFQCAVKFGSPLYYRPQEGREAFLDRAQLALEVIGRQA
jgi:1-acyl-sn-glycerol-3-phosphate acyltransferase